jgi:hypothetical protein
LLKLALFKFIPNGEIGMIISRIYRLMKHPFLEIKCPFPMVKIACPQKEKCMKIGKMTNAHPRKKHACLVLVIVC